MMSHIPIQFRPQHVLFCFSSDSYQVETSVPMLFPHLNLVILACSVWEDDVLPCVIQGSQAMTMESTVFWDVMLYSVVDLLFLLLPFAFHLRARAHEEFFKAVMCCSFSIIQGARVEISTDASNFTPYSVVDSCQHFGRTCCVHCHVLLT
jgi:hypothetical protein